MAPATAGSSALSCSQHQLIRDANLCIWVTVMYVSVSLLWGTIFTVQGGLKRVRLIALRLTAGMLQNTTVKFIHFYRVCQIKWRHLGNLNDSKTQRRLKMLRNSNKCQKMSKYTIYIFIHRSGLAVTFVTLVTLILFWLIDWLIETYITDISRQDKKAMKCNHCWYKRRPPICSLKKIRMAKKKFADNRISQIIA